MTDIGSILQSTLSNTTVMGFAAAAAAGSLAYGARTIPVQAWRSLKDLCSVTLVIQGDDLLHEYLSLWLSRHGRPDRSQRLMVQHEYDYGAGAWGWQITLGQGWHLIWLGGWPLFVHREVRDLDGMAALARGGQAHRMHLISPGRNIRHLKRLVAEAEQIYNCDGLVRVYFWHAGRYMLADRRPPRSMNTVFLPPAQKARLIDDVETFIAAKEDYRRRGTPWRRGYLFKGPPGTGKTSLIFALAGLLGRAVYVINLASVISDNDLMAAFNEVGADGVVVIEDIDAAEISHDRSAPVEAPQVVVAMAPGQPQNAPAKLTLSGLLNAIDGVAAREGRILFVTSNHPEKLDAALLRAGRLDVHEAVAPLGAEEAFEMFKAFRPGATRSDFNLAVATRLPIPAAELQNLLQNPRPAPGELAA